MAKDETMTEPLTAPPARLMPPPVAAWFLGISTARLKKYVAEGAISYVGARRSPLFDPSDLEKFITANRRTETCRSIAVRARRSGTTASKSPVESFVDRLKARRNAMPGASSGSNVPPPKKA
jgi:hypothetical protein